MIIVEGPDGSGKSTLIKNLGIEHAIWMGGVRVRSPKGVDWVSPGTSALSQFLNQITNYERNPVAFDRYHLSERIYGPLLRDRQEISDFNLRVINDLIHDAAIPVILCLPPYSAAYANVTEAGRPRPAYQTDAFLRRAYDEFLSLQPWATVVYDFTRDPIPVLPS